MYLQDFVAHILEMTTSKFFVTFQQCRNPNFRLATKAKGLQEGETKGRLKKHILYSRECRRVWENEPSHS